MRKHVFLFVSMDSSVRTTKSFIIRRLCIEFVRLRVRWLKVSSVISLFHRAFFNSIMYKTPTHALFHSTLYYSSVLISLKYTNIFNSTPTCFDLKRSSSGSMTVPC